MSDKSLIAWTEATWNALRARFTNPITGEVRVGWHCEHASEGCRFCYAEQRNKGFFQLGTKQPYTRPARDKVEVFLDEDTLLQPLKWRKPRMIFVCSMTDLFGEWHTDEMIDKVLAVMALAPQHIFQVLTKRAERMERYFADKERRLKILDQVCVIGAGFKSIAEELNRAGRLWGMFTDKWPLPSVWLGVSCEDQKTADERIPWLLKTPAAVRWISYEPALAAVDFAAYLPDNPVYEKQAKRGVCLPGSAKRGSGDRTGWQDLESPKEGLGSVATESGESALQAGQSGAQQRGVFPGSDNDRSEEGLRGCLAADLAPSLRADSGGSNSQPQGREQEARSSGQLRTSELFGTADSRDKSLEAGARLQSIVDEQFDGQNTAGGCRADTTAPTDRRETEGHSGRLRGSFSDGLTDRQGGPSCGWIVIGGESGPHARPFDLAWARNTIAQGKAAGVPVFVKQLGADCRRTEADQPNRFWRLQMKHKKGGDMDEWPEDLRVREFPQVTAAV